MNECNICRTSKSEELFRKGHARCKDCQNAARRELYSQDLESSRARAKEWRDAHPDSIKKSWQRWYATVDRSEYQRDYRQIPVVRERLMAADRERYGKDPHLSARRLIQTRVRTGRMPKASDCLCFDCGGKAAEYDHYLGYVGEQREAVQPVCRPCHLKRTYSRATDVAS